LRAGLPGRPEGSLDLGSSQDGRVEGQIVGQGPATAPLVAATPRLICSSTGEVFT
jgi:hypothetical protein